MGPRSASERVGLPSRIGFNPPIDRVGRISPEEFYERCLVAGRPLVLTEMTRDWPAMRKWSWDFFRELGGSRPVKIELGNVVQNRTELSVTTWRQYVDDLLGGVFNDRDRLPYIAYLKIFREFPELKADVDFSLISRFTRHDHPAAWIGPGGTITGYHIDRADNLLAQVVGSKRVTLIPRSESHWMYPSDKYDPFSAFSQVVAELWDAERWPLFGNTHAVETVLGPGEMLFIPDRWWHYVEALEPSISVNNFALTTGNIFRTLILEWCKARLHAFGLYKKGNCTCHESV